MKLNFLKLLIIPILLLSSSCKKKYDGEVTHELYILSVNYLNNNTIKVVGSLNSSNPQDINWLHVTLNNSESAPGIDASEEWLEGGSFEYIFTGLELETEYHLVAFAENEVGDWIYSNEITFNTPATNGVYDLDGNWYYTTTIGNIDTKQQWFMTNLKTTTYNDGAKINYFEDLNTIWSCDSIGFYGWYGNNIKMKETQYGALYNSKAINSNKLCPKGYHIPKTSEWNTLIELLGGAELAGGILKETGSAHWNIPNNSATNEYSFYAIPGGMAQTLAYENIGTAAYYWSNEGDVFSIWNNSSVIKYSDQLTKPGKGFCVRCIKDED